MWHYKPILKYIIVIWFFKGKKLFNQDELSSTSSSSAIYLDMLKLFLVHLFKIALIFFFPNFSKT